MKKEQFEQGKQGSGSAEQTNRNRNDQVQPNAKPSTQQRQDIASQIGEDSSRVAGLDDLGALSGRDDAAGGTGDRMENENTGNTTDR